jgi:hypothetical protein
MKQKKKGGLFSAVFLISLVFLPVLMNTTGNAQELHATMKVINLSGLDFDKELGDVDLLWIATLNPSENPDLFPPLKNLIITSGDGNIPYKTGIFIPSGSISFNGSITLGERMEFISPKEEGSISKFDAVVVTSVGTLLKIDKEIIIDYKERTIMTALPIHVDEGDVLLLFVRDVKMTHFGDKDLFRYEQKCG